MPFWIVVDDERRGTPEALSMCAELPDVLKTSREEQVAAIDRVLEFLVIDWSLTDSDGTKLPITTEQLAELPAQQRIDMIAAVVRPKRPWWRRWWPRS
jgi:hypothetical protein